MAEKAVDAWHRFEELVPWYINGTIAPEDRRWVDEFVLSHRAAATFLKWENALQTRLREAAPSFAPAAGFERLRARIRAERAPVHAALKARLRDAWLGLTHRPGFALAALTMVILQTGVIGALVGSQRDSAPEYARTRSLTPTASAPALLRVSFKSDATEANLRMLLVEIGGTIVGGPGQLGAYLVQVPPAQFAQATATLAASPWVMAAEVVLPAPVQP
jgi:hypothetical protein